MPVQELGQRKLTVAKQSAFCGRQTEWQNLRYGPTRRRHQPIRIEMLLGQSLYILKNIEFDVPVDESLVSMEPPAGYTLSSMEYSMNQFTEQDFIESLRIWAEYCTGWPVPRSPKRRRLRQGSLSARRKASVNRNSRKRKEHVLA